MSYYVPDYKLDPPEDKVFCECDACGQEIYEGGTYYDIDGDNIHDDCFELYFHQNQKIAGEGEFFE